MEKGLDFFGDFGPSRTIPRDVIDIILHNLNTKDVKSLGQVNRFFNTVIKNEDEELNHSRKKDLLIYTPNYNNGLYYKFFDDFNINKTKSLFLANILDKNKNIPRNLYYFEILKATNLGNNFIKHYASILEGKSFNYKISPSNYYYPNPDKNTIYIKFLSYFEILYGETGLEKDDLYNNFNVKPLLEEIYIDDVDKKKYITNLNKLKDIVNNNKDEHFTFIIENINESTKIGIKKLNFL